MRNQQDLLVPEWYINARNNGATQTELKHIIREFCLKAERRRSGNDNLDMNTVDEGMINTAFDMYEATLSAEAS